MSGVDERRDAATTCYLQESSRMSGRDGLTAFVLVLIVCSFARFFFRPSSLDAGVLTSTSRHGPPPILDAVFTWVNGSDPDFLKEISTYTKRVESNRYRGAYSAARPLNNHHCLACHFRSNACSRHWTTSLWTPLNSPVCTLDASHLYSSEQPLLSDTVMAKHVTPASVRH